MSIAGLDPDSPSDDDNAGAGAAEIRGVKTALKAVLGGLNSAVRYGIAGAPVTSAQLTALFDRLDAVETAAAAAGVLVQGMTMFWPYSVASIPTGWAQATGATVNGFATRDMRGRFPLGVDAAGLINPGDTGGSGSVAIATTSSGSVSAGTTGGTSLSVANIPDIAASLRIPVATGSSGIAHNVTTNVAGGEGSATDRAIVGSTGLSGTAHTHTTPAVSAHTHEVTPPYPLWLGGCWITYVGVA